MNTTNSSTLNQAGYRSNILGATGLPKAVLAGMFRRDGLFGRDSSLSGEEQSVLQSRLPAVRGLKALAAIRPLTPRLAVLADLADALVRGADASAQQARALRAGFGAHAVLEVETVVGNVFAVFGPFAAQTRAASSGSLAVAA
jgi:hypothetical protein